VGLQSPHITNTEATVGRSVFRRGEARRIDAQRDLTKLTTKSLGAQNAPSLGIADIGSRRSGQSPSLDPAERRRVALEEILGRVEEEGNPVGA
jgi:hypothetical protein